METACAAPGSSARRRLLVRFLSRDDAEAKPRSGTRRYAQHRRRRGAPNFAHDLWFVRTSDRWAVRRASVGQSRCASNRYSIKRIHIGSFAFPLTPRVICSHAETSSSGEPLSSKQCELRLVITD